MKMIIALALAVFTIEASAANVTAQVKELAQYSYGVKSWKVRGKTADEMLTDFSLRVSRMDKDEFKLVNFPREIPSAEDGGVQAGLCKFPQAVDLIVAEARTKDNEDAGREEIEKIWAAARKLKDAGLKFGYTTSGSSNCGVMWTDPLIIDVKNNLIWQIFLVGGPC